MNKSVIICVDDEISVLKSLKAELRETVGREHSIELVEGGEDALELIEKLLAEACEIPLIIADQLMPDIKGDELLKRVHVHSPKTLKVMLTGQASLEDVSNAIRYANLYRYIAKPWQAGDLQLTVREAINSYLQDKKITEQYTQLQQVNQALIESEQKYRSIFENALEGIFQSTSTGQFLSVNPALAQLYGYDSPEELIATVKDIQHQLYVDPDRWLEFVTLMQQEDAVTGFESQVYRKDGSTIWISETAQTVRDASGNIYCFQGFIINITERKQTEQLLADYNHTLETQVAERTTALRQQKELLQTIFDHIPVVINLYDKSNQIQLVNRAHEKILGWSQAELKEIDLLAECYPDPVVRQQVLQHMMTADGKWQDQKLRTREGRYVDIAWTDVRLSDGMRIGIGQDITDRKRAEEASILEERNRMAREIHDTLAQAFTGIIIHARSVASKLVANPEKAQNHLIQLQELARSGLAEARRSVEALRRPSLLENGNLQQAIDRLASQMRASTDTRIVSNVVGVAYPLPSHIENNLLRIAQEALTNAIKYAKANEIRIELVYDSQCILRIQDDGQGFVVDHPAMTSRGFGLLGMNERTERIGARLQIRSAPGQGTEVVVIVDRE